MFLPGCDGCYCCWVDVVPHWPVMFFYVVVNEVGCFIAVLFYFIFMLAFSINFHDYNSYYYY